MKFTDAYNKFLVEEEIAQNQLKDMSNKTLEKFLETDFSFDELMKFIEEHPESELQKEKVVRLLHSFIKFFNEGQYQSWKKKTGKDDKVFNEKELEDGVQVELEHTSDSMIANKIAKDHLTEDPKYYSKLKEAKL